MKNIDGGERTGEPERSVVRLAAGSPQSGSHRESRAQPSAPKLTGRRRGGEATRPRAVGRGERTELRWWRRRPRTGQIFVRGEPVMDDVKGSGSRVKAMGFSRRAGGGPAFLGATRAQTSADLPRHVRRGFETAAATFVEGWKMFRHAWWQQRRAAGAWCTSASC